MSKGSIRLTQYSHGAGCGCKIAPDVLTRILAADCETKTTSLFPSLLVGNQSRDDAAAVALNDELALLSTTDFFMPIVDDPYDFGRIAATNAVSDIYAMGGQPVVAVAILGWPIAKLGADIANQVIRGGRDVCQQLGFPLAGGHSIDCPEPIFGLAVTGTVLRKQLKRNDDAKSGDQLILTKPLGIGIHATAEKQGKLKAAHVGLASTLMCQPNSVGPSLAEIAGVNALTDVTGFGLAGHLLEMCEGANLDATIDTTSVPELPGLDHYIALGCVPGGTARNFSASAERLPQLSTREQAILCDPQTSGGLLISVAEQALPLVQQLLSDGNLPCAVIGSLSQSSGRKVRITVSSPNASD
jgi:selenide,water dikinase